MNHERFYITDETVIEHMVSTQKQYFYAQQTKSINSRIQALNKLRDAVKQNEQRIMDALKQDLNKSEVEAYTSEIGILLEEIRFTLKHLAKWMKPKKVKTALTHVGSKGKIVPEPYGVALIIAPWNYPFQLALSPLVGAIAAGNTAIIKPSELTPSVSRVIQELLAEAFDPAFVTVIEGAVETTSLLLKQPLDYIFFTGSVNVGKIIMQEAGKQLIPVTLELGGKSPCIVHEDANLDLAAKRIMFGKGMNAGQTCVAPDYLLVHKKVKAQLVEKLREAIYQFYGSNPLESDRYGRIVSERHFTRLVEFLKDGNATVGGGYNKSTLTIEPTVLSEVSWTSDVMQEEIFGPILPMIEYETLDEVIHKVQEKAKPLALYLFTESEDVQNVITERLSFGGGCINDTLMHIATPYLPFGGVGESGTGQYHGKDSFQTFSHFKSMLAQTTKFDFSFRYPSEKQNLKMIKKLLK
ncbi:MULTISPECIES: aldehyde dehydrogenase [Priestia]|uniref:aldehyde dehydrogenase n=1 Tax=Priestia TaxID=2800373 RepID=UPI000407058C|nr:MULTISPECIES: aldehyde dehydrogenase [Priestia]MBK0006561.1 aldehyde dehydrogenase [Bacillus sp. S35]MCM3254771.1 aldehyde dehydrogenase [Priestia aryabhattai]MCM3641125.1 aldehyde dehydrogenase [Priestia aryabhattai]PFW79402.1 aldehyde dehydrogenase [Priestia aryabhattai]